MEDVTSRTLQSKLSDLSERLSALSQRPAAASFGAEVAKAHHILIASQKRLSENELDEANLGAEILKFYLDSLSGTVDAAEDFGAEVDRFFRSLGIV